MDRCSGVWMLECELCLPSDDYVDYFFSKEKCRRYYATSVNRINWRFSVRNFTSQLALRRRYLVSDKPNSIAWACCSYTWWPRLLLRNYLMNMHDDASNYCPTALDVRRTHLVIASQFAHMTLHAYAFTSHAHSNTHNHHLHQPSPQMVWRECMCTQRMCVFKVILHLFYFHLFFFCCSEAHMGHWED